ncbi:MAG TPA: hypothetical protein VI056_08735 [Candidatus Limnocylindria bacterium]
MSRRRAVRPIRGAAHVFATIVAVAVMATILTLSGALMAVRFVGLSTYVVQGGPTESMVPIGSLVLVAPVPSGTAVAAEPAASGDASAPTIGTAWVAIPTLGYAVSYADAYSSPIVMGLIMWIIFVIAVRALEPYMSNARRRLAA